MSEFDNFKKFLAAKGAEVLSPTNPYELVRFRANGQVSVVYRGKRGHSFVGEAEQAWKAYKNSGRGWMTDARKEARQRMSPLFRTLLDRDGDLCFYCKQPMITGQISVEHLLSTAHGGTSHLSNLALAHPVCNEKVGHLSVMDKVKIRESAK